MKTTGQSVVVVGGMIYDHMSGIQQEWIGMIEKVLHSQGYFPDFPEYSKLCDEIGISEASTEELKTVWWEKYQVMVRGVGDILSGKQ